MVSISFVFCLLLHFFILCSCTTLPTTSTTHTRFRPDYFYMSQTHSYYKIHTLPATWLEAKYNCKLETARLFYPDDEEEVTLIFDYWKRTQRYIDEVFIGVSDLVAKGVFETIDGRPVSAVYHKWDSNEPNNANNLSGGEDCVTLNTYGYLNDVACGNTRRYICKKRSSTIEWNNACGIPDNSYDINNKTGKCYKLHTTPMTWPQAHAACVAEQSYLAIINNEKEAEEFAKLATAAPTNKIRGSFLNDTILLGFHDRLNDGWATVRGQPLEDSGYSSWSQREPDNDEHKQCGAMSFEGLLKSLECNKKALFICEHDIENRTKMFIINTGLPSFYVL